MNSKLLHEDGERTFALVFDKGDEVIAELEKFAREHSITAARFTAIGAFSDVKLGYIEPGLNNYLEIPVEEQVELLSLDGDIAELEGKPKAHAHAVVGRRDGHTRGGHLLEAHVWPTLELMLVESPQHLRRKVDEETGLPLIDLG